MKEIKKLAHEWQQEELKKRPLQPFEDYYKTTWAYESGFLKARQMAAKLMGEKYPFPSGVGLQAPLMISEIGESEVKE